MSKSDYLLSILSACNTSPIRGKTRLVKLMYIVGVKLKREHKDVDFYSFYKHFYGPYSDEITNDLETLSSQKLIKHEIVQHDMLNGIYEENIYEITANGIKELKKKRDSINPNILRIIEQVKTKYNNIPLSMLIQEVYTKYPLRKQQSMFS